jgi:hypothetical protein
MQHRFTKAEVDYLVAEAKVIKDIPPQTVEGDYWVIRQTVCKKSEPNTKVQGSLYIYARVAIPVPGTPRAIPGVALMWHGHRIRGFDHETWHDNPDKTKVLGWHEHLWSQEYKDCYVRAVAEPQHKDMIGILKVGLRLWNIEVLSPQLEVD